jgi:hypothetical protein
MWITATALFYAWDGREVLEISTGILVGRQSHIYREPLQKAGKFEATLFRLPSLSCIVFD